ncbi:hypothetical protein [Rhodovulum marinum]|uniref:Uncharacterized protein n=1 Tax=Rhodovulum marinum TaxID=320662 RepID=A0A4R2PSG6_9RHOB|nr:hypothetical protein [Rhodovulum marinum]TCP38799.1 hypothetical protein EV662_11733 [Rhodovulum marinum]
MAYSTDKDIDRLVKSELGNGARLASGKRHGKLILANGRRIISPRTPSDRRAWLNLRSDIRRATREMERDHES